MLTNQDYDSSDYFALVLVGLPHVNNILVKPYTRPWRSVWSSHCEGLSREETTDYVYTRIEAAGGARSIIEEAAIHAISGYSNGAPRIINSVMTNALLLGTQLQKKTIDSEAVLAATNNLILG